MTTSKKEITSPEEDNRQLLSTYVHVENVNGPQFILNCGHRSLKEMLALQEQAIQLQLQLTQPRTTAVPLSSTAVPQASGPSQVPIPATSENPPQATPSDRKASLRKTQQTLFTPEDTPGKPVKSKAKKNTAESEDDFQDLESQKRE